MQTGWPHIGGLITIGSPQLESRLVHKAEDRRAEHAMPSQSWDRLSQGFVAKSIDFKLSTASSMSFRTLSSLAHSWMVWPRFGCIAVERFPRIHWLTKWRYSLEHPQLVPLHPMFLQLVRPLRVMMDHGRLLSFVWALQSKYSMCWYLQMAKKHGFLYLKDV